jgi:hypothetical protein
MNNYLTEGVEIYSRYRDLGSQVIDVNAIESALITGSAKEAIDALCRDYFSCNDGKGAAMYQRAIAGWLIWAGSMESQNMEG